MPDKEGFQKFEDVIQLLKETANDDLKYRVKCEDIEDEEEMC